MAKSAKPNARAITLTALLLCVGLFVFYLVADRLIPNTDMARVQGHVIPLSAQVSGQVVAVNVAPNQRVIPGQPLFEIDPKDYLIALEEAQQGLVLAGKHIGVQTANVAAAQAKLSDALIHQEDVLRQAKRIFAIAKKGVVTQAEVDKQKADVAHAKAQLASARAGLAQAQKQLGETGERNTEMQAALLALQKAQLNLERTVIRAPDYGVVSNLRLSEGVYAAAGQALLTFVSSQDVWIEAYYRENNLGNINDGSSVEVTLDNAPGEVFTGRVASIEHGVSWGQQAQSGQLAAVGAQTGWLRQSQRFPVIIRFDDQAVHGLLRVGGQADVIVYTDKSALMNEIGKVWIRLVSWLSYVR